VNRILTAYQHN